MLKLIGRIPYKEFLRRTNKNFDWILDGRKRRTGFLWGKRRIYRSSSEIEEVKMYGWEEMYEETISELSSKYDSAQVRILLDLYFATMRSWRETQITPVMFVPGLGNLYMCLREILFIKVRLTTYFRYAIRLKKTKGSPRHISWYNKVYKALLVNLRLFYLGLLHLNTRERSRSVIRTWIEDSRHCFVDEGCPTYDPKKSFWENRTAIIDFIGRDKLFIGLDLKEEEKHKILYYEKEERTSRKKHEKRTPKRVIT